MVDKIYSDGLMAGGAIRDGNGKRIDTTYTKVYSTTNPALTVSSGECTWTVTHSLGSTNVVAKVYRVSDSTEVVANAVATSTSVVTITLISQTNISSGTYKVVVMGV